MTECPCESKALGAVSRSKPVFCDLEKTQLVDHTGRSERQNTLTSTDSRPCAGMAFLVG